MPDTPEKPEVLILGASGYIGRRTFKAFGNARAMGTYRSTPIPGGIFFDPSRMRLEDILPRESSFSHAIVLFAQLGLDACKADLEASYEINVRCAKQTIDDLMKLGIKPIYASSQAVFDGEKGDYTEEDEPNPINVYGSQNFEVEQYLSQICEDYAILRLSTVIGSEPDDGTLISNWLKPIHLGEEIRCAGDEYFSPVHLDDVVAAIDAAIRLDLCGLYQVSSTESLSRLEMARTLVDCLETETNLVECSIRDFDFLDNRALNLSMNPTKIMAATGLQFKSVRCCCEKLAQYVPQLEK